ncbi:MAG TPA: hypothetical protein VIM11_06705 [Tepidisphaeraceae bacterium]|jgi:hypothetical protein
MIDKLAGTGWKPVSRTIAFSLILLLAMLATGCIVGKQNPAATQPATAGDPKSVQLAYWFDKPAITDITSTDFDKIWNACRNSLIADGFLIDRLDYRDGVITTLPLVSKQFYEVWRMDVVTVHDLAQSSLGTMRRTVRIDIRRQPDGTYRACPKVVVDRFSLLAKRITSVAQYRSVFALTTSDLRLSTEEDGPNVVAQYWYPVARDYNLEKDLIASIRSRIE